MSHTLMLIPTSPEVGLASVSLGLVRAIDNLGIRVGFFKPVAQREQTIYESHDHVTEILKKQFSKSPPPPVSLALARDYLTKGHQEALLELIISKFSQYKNQVDVIVVEGMVVTKNQAYALDLNVAIARALDAYIIFVSAPTAQDIRLLDNQLEYMANLYGGFRNSKILGCILNKVNQPIIFDETLPVFMTDVKPELSKADISKSQLLVKKLPLLGSISWQEDLTYPRVLDIAKFLKAQIINAGEQQHRRVHSVHLCARTVDNILDILKTGTLLITSADRSDIILAASMAVLSGIKIAGLVLTGGYPLNDKVMTLCKQALLTGLPILYIKDNSFNVTSKLVHFDTKIPIDDEARIEQIMLHVASHIKQNWIKSLLASHYEPRMTPPAFRFYLIKKAKEKLQKIILPEATEPRTLEAAITCHDKKIAQCFLLGIHEEIQKTANALGLTIPKGMKIIEPNKVRKKYIAAMVEIRKHKNLTPAIAEEQLHDNVVLGTMMLQLGEVDGLVSGAVHTTANTIRPALQLIKTDENSRIVSSIFFMCLPDQVVIYGDCAVNANPTADELAQIAIQSADSALTFGIIPKVAMLSYSTGESGSGVEVEKVRKATNLVKQLRPDIIIDGPLQYDAAFNPSVAKTKAANSPVAGQATVFIFPDLNTGNTTYKAVQRSANVVCMGPMLQGLHKPVNDLSRGSSVEDIIYTIALTAIQSQSKTL